MDEENCGTTFKAKGIFEVEVEMFASLEQMEKLKAGDPETVADFQNLCSELAQENINWGNTPFDVSDCEFDALRGKGFEPEKSNTE
jgi:hypothetical protein